MLPNHVTRIPDSQIAGSISESPTLWSTWKTLNEFDVYSGLRTRWKTGLVEVKSVTGSISPSDLGITLPHEHVLCDLTCLFKESLAKRGVPASKVPLIEAPVRMNNLGELRRDLALAYLQKDNLRLCEIHDAIEEIMKFRMAGGRSIVDVTVRGLARDPAGLKAVSVATGVNIVCSTGWYRELAHPSSLGRMSVNELADIMIRDLTEGIDGTETRAGVIGELGTSLPLTEGERRVLEAAGKAQSETGAALTIHVEDVDLKQGLLKKAGEYIDLVLKGGANSSKIYLSHMDCCFLNIDYQRSIVDKYGVTIDYDTFGQEAYIDSAISNVRQPSDGDRIAGLVELLKSGYEKHLMISNDVCTKVQYKKYGGYGYAHIIEHIAPALRLEGISNKQIDAMLIDNPKRILAW